MAKLPVGGGNKRNYWMRKAGRILVAGPLTVIVIFLLMDLCYYLFLLNELKSASHQVLERVIQLPDFTTAGWNPAPARKTEFMSSLMSGELGKRFSAGKHFLHARARLVSADSSSDPDNWLEVFLPSESVINDQKDLGIIRKPVGVRLLAVFNPMTPFLPDQPFSAGAWGFKNFPIAPVKARLDCTGRVFDRKRLPEAEECGCKKIDAKNGQCACEGLKEWRKSPDSGKYACLCSEDHIYERDEEGRILIDLMGAPKPCGQGRLLNFESCECAGLCKYGDRMNFGQRRDSSNQCSCLMGLYYRGAPPGLRESAPGRLVLNDAVTEHPCRYQPGECSYLGKFHLESEPAAYYRCDYKKECSSTRVCPSGSRFSGEHCGCVCDKEATDNAKSSCIIDRPGERINQVTGYTLSATGSKTGYKCTDSVSWDGDQSEMLGKDCSVSYPSLKEIPPSCFCQCKAGFRRTGTGCCKESLCYDLADARYRKPRLNEIIIVDRLEDGHNACLCACPEGMIEDSKQGGCISPSGREH